MLTNDGGFTAAMVELAVDPVVVTDVLVELEPPQPATIAATATAVSALNLIGHRSSRRFRERLVRKRSYPGIGRSADVPDSRALPAQAILARRRP
jgi:hypothetical protein